ncbi:MAG: efflux RND transporter periplasmic adaptor subunit [Chthoniobacterales bacterium]|nr:efflux RND transporter periplasmic adaptor subunit [Chthoniobacterales bacterium]
MLIYSILISVFVEVFLVGCSPSGDIHSKSEESLPAIQVQLLTLEPDPATSIEEVPGTIRPVESAILSSKVSGTITEVEADPGRVVKKGDVLAQIDDREIRARLESARASLEQAQRDFNRFQQLYQDRIITTQEFEIAQTRLRSAMAAEAEARTLLGYTTITSPFDGVVTRRFIQRGDLAVPGRPLVEVENPGRLRLEAQVPESLIPSMGIGQTIEVRVDAARVILPGRISEIAPASDPASRTTLVKIDLPENPALRSGQFGRAQVPTDSEPTLRIPTSALLTRGQLDFVYVNNSGKASLRIVRTGRRSGDFVEILAGLSAGEQILAKIPPEILQGQPLLPIN